MKAWTATTQKSLKIGCNPDVNETIIPERLWRTISKASRRPHAQLLKWYFFPRS